MSQYGLSPSDFGALTYPQLVAIMTRGNPDRLEAEHWAAKKALADIAAGLYKW